jgi:hypothetical protein
MRRIGVAVVVFSTSGYVSIAMAKPPRRALEVSAQTGYGHVWGKNGDRSHEIESRNGGPSIALGLSYRSPYLFVPWAEVGWTALRWSRESPKAHAFLDQTPSISSLSTSYLLLGPSIEEGIFRFRAGMGAYRLQVTSSFAGHTITPSSWDMGYFLSYGMRAYDGPRFGWGLETQALLMSESQLAYLGIALRVWGNAWADLR